MASVGADVKGSRRSLDAEINLVPFIDLLSMCICFLLMTAVWMEIGAVNIKQLVGTEAASEPKNSYEMDVRFKTPEQMEIGLKRTGVKPQIFTVTGSTHEARITNLREIL